MGMNLQPRQTLDLQSPTTVRYQVLGWVCVLSMITYIDRVCIKQVRGDMQDSLGLTDAQFAWVFSAFGLASTSGCFRLKVRNRDVRPAHPAPEALAQVGFS